MREYFGRVSVPSSTCAHLHTLVTSLEASGIGVSTADNNVQSIDILDEVIHEVKARNEISCQKFEK